MNKTKWLKEIDAWMEMKGYPILTWDEVVRREGTSGPKWYDRIDEFPESYPYLWKESNQTNENVYRYPEYVYSLLFGLLQNSRYVYGPIAKLEKGNRVVDVGGSIFTAKFMTDRGVFWVDIVNLENTPQFEFAQYIIDKYDLPISIENEFRKFTGYTLVMSEFLEHFKEPLKTLLSYAIHKPYKIYESSSYCTPAYGHYCPVVINGKEYTHASSASRVVRKEMVKLGWKKEIIPVFNHSFAMFTMED